MIVVEESAEAYVVRGADLEIAYRHLGDRWQHRISVRHGGRSIPLLVSEEGRPDGDELPSPALQDLRLEMLADNLFEFQLLGQARKGVYSAAVRLDATAQTIDFDVCARGPSRESPLCTFSRYVLAGSAEARNVHQSGTVLIVEQHALRGLEVSPVAIAGQPAAECRSMTAETVRRIAVGCSRPKGSDVTNKRISVRWRYRMALAGQP